MKVTLSPIILFIPIFALLLTPVTKAAEITLHDGSRYNGELIDSDDQLIYLRVKNANQNEVLAILRIQVSKISKLSAEESKKLKDSDVAPVQADRPQPAAQQNPPTNNNTPSNPSNPTSTSTSNTTTPPTNTTPNPNPGTASNTNNTSNPTPSTPTSSNNNSTPNSNTTSNNGSTPTNTNSNPSTTNNSGDNTLPGTQETIKDITELVDAPEYKALQNTIKLYRQTLEKDEFNENAKTKLTEALEKRERFRQKAYGHLSTGLRQLREARYKSALENLYTASTWPEIRPLVKQESGMNMLHLIRACLALARNHIDVSDGTGLIDEDVQDFYMGRKKESLGNGTGNNRGKPVGNGSGVEISKASQGTGVLLAPQGAVGMSEVFSDNQQIGLVRLYHTTLLIQAGGLNIYNPISKVGMKKSPFDQSETTE